MSDAGSLSRGNGDTLAKVCDDFILAVTSEELSSQLVENASEWYLAFLKSRIEEGWASIFEPVLTEVETTTHEPTTKDLCYVFQIFITIVNIMKKQENIALVDIVDQLYSTGALKSTDEFQSHATQMAFVAFGWTSMLIFSLFG